MKTALALIRGSVKSMLYREFGKTGEKISILGFGCMRFQVEDNDPKKIIEEKAIEQVRHAIDKGVNYIDTAYPYHGGMSELVVAKALKDGYRERIKLATKLPSWLVKSREDMDRLLNEQLEKLQTDHIDFYLMWAASEKTWMTLSTEEQEILTKAAFGAVDAVKPQIQQKDIRVGYSNSRTCEIGLETNSGIPYESIVYLIDKCTSPVNIKR